MTLPRYYVLCRYYEKHPPLHLMVQRYLGINQGTDEDGWKEISEDEYRRLVSEMENNGR